MKEVNKEYDEQEEENEADVEILFIPSNHPFYLKYIEKERKKSTARFASLKIYTNLIRCLRRKYKKILFPSRNFV